VVKRVFALAAHPDDIEFLMAGTLLLLAQFGCEIHYMTIANGSCGSVRHDGDTTAAIRRQEAMAAAAHIPAIYHPPLVNDLEIFYDRQLLARVSSVVRSIQPDILLLHSPQDYMEDHTNACRLGVTAAFCRGMRNFPVDPPIEPYQMPVCVYHSQPHGHRDGLNQKILPEFAVNIDSVMPGKSAMLAEHASQQEWLDQSQGMNAYIQSMQDFAAEMAELAGGCRWAEGWRRHNPVGLCAADEDLMRTGLPPEVILPMECRLPQSI
jgi:N-acetylglucosamine malate deacetylase 1